MGETLLSIQDLFAYAGEKPILNGVSLDIPSGEIHALIGPNGAGKSTLGHVLLGSPEYSVRSGHIFFDGNDITSLSTDKRAKAGLFLSFQEPEEVPGITLESFLRAAVQQVSGKKVRLLEFSKELEKNMNILKMPLSYASRDLNSGFSGGEKKKSEILQLLMLKPRLAVLDETDSGLDVDACRVVSEGINEFIKTTGGSLLLITHSKRILENLKLTSSHIMVKGRIVCSGDGSLVDKVNAEGFDSFIPESVKEEERKEKLALAAKNAMSAAKVDSFPSESGQDNL